MKVYRLLILLLIPFSSMAQEFDCEVTIDDQRLEGTSFNYVKQTLKPELESYINEHRWTEVEFTEQERIKCQISITLTSADQNFNYSAETVFSSRRPIYNTMSETTVFIINDPTWQFNYPQGKSLIHDDLQFESLTGMIDYYCYLMLGYDFDTFSNHGGDEYLDKAQNVVDLAQTASAIGWARNSNNQRNRYTLISDLNSANYEPLRTAYYTYHRFGLDTFTQSPEESREKVLEALRMIQSTKRRSTNNYLFDLFFDTKSREIASIFQDADSQIKLQAYNILRDTDQGHLSEYEDLQN